MEGIETELPEAPINGERLEQFLSNNRTLAFAVNPALNEGVAWIMPQNKLKSKELPIQKEESKVYPTFIPGFDYSNEYREFIVKSFVSLRDMLEFSLNRHLDMRFSPEISQIVNGYIDAINSTGSIQKLADVNNIIRCFQAVCFQADNQNNIAKPFMDWVNYSNVNPATEYLAEIMSTDKPAEHPQFWQCISSLALRNLLDLAIQSLQAVVSSFTNSHAHACIQHIITLLQSYNSESAPHVFRSWKDEVLQGHQNASYIKDPELRHNITTLLQILSGEQGTILSVSTSWFEAIAAFFCYVDPTRLRLEEYYEIAVKHLPVDVTVTWEEGCSAVMTGQYFLAIEKIESLDPFAAAVICESCEAKGLMDNYTDNSFIDVRNWLLINFAKLCISDPDLAEVGIDLLDRIRTNEAREIFAEFITRVDFKTPEDAERAIYTAHGFALPEVARALNRIMAKKMEAEGSYVEALIHYETSKDLKALVHVAWKLFEDVLISGVPSDNLILIDAVNNTLDFEISATVRNALAPYAVLAKAFEYMNQNASSQAARHISALFKFPYMPVKYLGLLFLLASNFLDRTQPRVFNTGDIVHMMKALEKWEDEENAKQRDIGLELLEHVLQMDNEEKWANFKKDIQAGLAFSEFRMQLAKEVSRAFLEGS